MRILVIAPTPFFADRGGHVRIIEELKAVKALGHKPVVFTYHLGNDVPGFEIRRTFRIPWYTKQEAGPSYHKLYLDILLFWKVLWALWREDWDIIHAHLHEGAFIAGMARSFRFKRIPLLFDYQGSLVKEMQDHRYLTSAIAKWFFGRIERMANSFADLIITSSTNAAQLLWRDFGESQSHVQPLIDAVDTSQFHPRVDSAVIRHKLKLPKDRKIIAYLGVLSEYQGVGMMLEAFHIVAQKFPKVHFLIMGYPNVEQYQRLARKLGILAHCTFTGRVDYKLAPQYIKCGDIAVSFKASETEANGKIYNYMALGLPSVVSDTAVNREILGDLGIYCAQKPDAIAEQILALLHDPERCHELGKKSADKIVREHSWQARGKQLEGIYEELVRETDKK